MERSARAQGGASAAWIDALPDLVESLVAEWGLTVGATLHGGSSSYVAEAVSAEGKPAILKITMPGEEPVEAEIRALKLAGGRGYAKLFAADGVRRALLVERLGSPLAGAGWSEDRQMETLVTTLMAGWRKLPDGHGVPTLPEKAAWLIGFIPQAWEALGRPCSQRVIDRALDHAQGRIAAFAPESAVLLHGDPHSLNALADPKAVGRYRFVDPDGVYGEPAYDLGILMRDWSESLLAGDPLELGRKRCARLAKLSGQPEAPIWAWGMVERTSTALYAWKLGAEQEGRRMLAVAEAWADA